MSHKADCHFADTQSFLTLPGIGTAAVDLKIAQLWPRGSRPGLATVRTINAFIDTCALFVGSLLSLLKMLPPQGSEKKKKTTLMDPASVPILTSSGIPAVRVPAKLLYATGSSLRVPAGAIEQYWNMCLRQDFFDALSRLLRGRAQLRPILSCPCCTGAGCQSRSL